MTTEEFVKSIWMLWKEEKEDAFSSCFGDFFAFGRKRGWLEDQDERGRELPVNHMTAARIMHCFLQKELGEADELDWRGAERLKDIYDCHTCVNHVAQMYSKGIMGAENQVFGMQRLLTAEEADLVLARLFGKAGRLRQGQPWTVEEKIQEARKLQEKSIQEKSIQEKSIQEKSKQEESKQEKSKQEKSIQEKNIQEKVEIKKQSIAEDKKEVSRGLKTIQYEEALQLLSRYPQAVLVDVRSRAEYEKDGLTGALHIPLLSILEHPERMDAYLKVPVILYCDQGERSRIAAECLLQWGYQQVYQLLL